MRRLAHKVSGKPEEVVQRWEELARLIILEAVAEIAADWPGE